MRVCTLYSIRITIGKKTSYSPSTQRLIVGKKFHFLSKFLTLIVEFITTTVKANYKSNHLRNHLPVTAICNLHLLQWNVKPNYK